MGWWGYDIMEGDTPLDCQGDIIDFVADPVLVAAVDTADNWMDATDEVEHSGFAALQNEATVRNVYRAIQDGELCGYSPNIAMQVLGEMVMCSGGAFPQAARAACVAAAEAEIEYGDKGWRTEGAREKCLKAYIARVWAYENGTAIEPTSEGLFEKMSQAIEAGEQGLINVQGAA